MNQSTAQYQTLLAGFRSYLHAQNYHPNTIRNYFADVNKFLMYGQGNALPLSTIFSTANLLNYLQYISTQNNSQRFLASLKIFCQYALDQKLISHNPLPSLIKHLHRQSPAPKLNQLLKLYQADLQKNNMSLATIKNYINDIQQFINWLPSQSPLPCPSVAEGEGGSKGDLPAGQAGLEGLKNNGSQIHF